VHRPEIHDSIGTFRSIWFEATLVAPTHHCRNTGRRNISLDQGEIEPVTGQPEDPSVAQAQSQTQSLLNFPEPVAGYVAGFVAGNKTV
jgi:hypothetical protein